MSTSLGRTASREATRAGAYTLVELSIVLAIIGILASTAGVQYTRALERARMARAIAELQGIAKQLEPMGDDRATLPETLGEVGLVAIDPWGNAYQYLRIEGGLPRGLSVRPGELPHVAAGGGGRNVLSQARKDRFLVPINSDFDLFSMGPDGDSKAPLNAKASRDDVIRAADGAYYGPAEGF